MPIESSAGLGLNITRETVGPKIRKGGALDPEAVLVCFHTQQDDRVRPSHAALEGKVFRLDDPNRPSPPLDWGCRCYLEYVAPEDSPVAAVLPEAADDPTTPPVAFAEYLDDELPKVWRTVRKVADAAPAPRRMAVAVNALRRVLPKDRRADLRELARMIVEAYLEG